jgi:type IV pilus assembly protein PilX
MPPTSRTPPARSSHPACSKSTVTNDAGNSCAKPLDSGSATAAKRGSADYANTDRLTDDTAGVYYRIVVRVVGARKTTSYVETIVHL